MKKKMTYASSGVNIHQANRFVSAIGRLASQTKDAHVLDRKGSFGALYEFDQAGYKNPVFVSSTDGVGTKLLIAKALNKHDTVGIDLVAMNVNDILCVGARPMFFLDYIACGYLDPDVLKDVIRGVVRGCRLSGCSLIGGETAEMPGMYKRDDYDLAGFAVGVVEKDKIIDGSSISAGDQVIGLASSGLHSNGFSLARKVLSLKEQKEHGKELLSPTRIYVEIILRLIQQFQIKGIAHITGGAFYEKLTRILPEGKCARLDQKSWPVPGIFKLIQEKGRVEDSEMYRTFNMGIGLALVIGPKDVDPVRAFLSAQGMKNYHIGEILEDRKRKIII
ncbi:MAG: phosphoribosylformylglycinamidine cyclo-ligase [Candidatus Omnitrophota bacterium]